MQSLEFSQFIISQKEGTLIRRCPFCTGMVEDGEGKEINFLVHLGEWIEDHQNKREWSDYIQRINFL